MNKQNLANFIRKPGEITPSDMQHLRQVVNDYPYFQDARILLAKASNTMGEKDAPKLLSSAAVYATNRGMLKKFINNEIIFLRSIDAKESIFTPVKNQQPLVTDVAEIAQVTIAEAQEAIVDEPSAKNLAPEETTTTETPVEEKTEIIQSVADTSEISETKIEEKTEDTPVPQQKITEKSPDPIQAKAITANTPKETNVKAKDPESNELDKLIEDIWNDVAELKKSKAKFLELERKMEEEEAVNLALKKANEQLLSQPEDHTEDDEENAEEDDEPEPNIGPMVEISAPIQPYQFDQKNEDNVPFADKSENEKDQIIEDFIKANPSISRNDIATAAKGDLLGNSAQFNPEVASEYLAEIFLEQGKNDKAIQIYEVLIVKFPEKSLYFADIIKNLKREL